MSSRRILCFIIVGLVGAKMRGSICVLAACLSVAGCSSTLIKTEKLVGGEQAAQPLNGIVYFLPRDYALVQVKRQKCALSIDLKAPTRIADINHRYVVRYDKNPMFRNNEITLEVESGLLKTVNGTSENKTGDVVAKIFDLGTSMTMHKGGVCDVETDFDLTFTIDPTRTWSGAQEALNNAQVFPGSTLLTVEALQPSSNSPVPTDAIEPDCLSEMKSISGVCYRLTSSYVLRITLSEGGLTVQRAYLVTAVDPTRVFSVPFDTGAFAKFDVRLTFDKGVLSKFESKDPPEALAAMQIPSEIVKGVLGLSSDSAPAPRK